MPTADKLLDDGRGRELVQLPPGKRWADPAVPRPVVMAMPVDAGESLLMHKRSSRVRSAKGVWSFPTGLLELGETIAGACARELREEHSLELLRSSVLGAYENIAPEAGVEGQVEQYHWVFTVVGCLVADVRAASNNEPEKHEQVKVAQVLELADHRFWTVHRFHGSFEGWARARCVDLMLKLQELCRHA